jgi:hypothetical protein
VDIKCFQPKQYLHWLLKRNIPIDNWDNDQIYDCWLQDYVFIEPAWDAFERSIKNMIAWGEETSQPYENYFKTAGTARIITDIRKIAVSGWSVFSSDSGKTWVGELELGDWNLVLAWLNPDRWAIQLTKYPVEVEKFSKMCKEAGL